MDHDYVNQLLGKNGLMLWSYANGLDDSPVMEKDFVSPTKSVGHGITCKADLKTEEEVWKVILELCQFSNFQRHYRRKGKLTLILPCK